MVNDEKLSFGFVYTAMHMVHLSEQSRRCRRRLQFYCIHRIVDDVKPVSHTIRTTTSISCMNENGSSDGEKDNTHKQ